MNSDDIRVRIESGECLLDGFLPCVAAGHHAQRAEQTAPFFLQHFLDPVDLLLAHCDYDVVDQRRCDELAHGVHKDGRAFKQHELLAAGAGCFGGATGRPTLHSGAQTRLRAG